MEAKYTFLDENPSTNEERSSDQSYEYSFIYNLFGGSNIMCKYDIENHALLKLEFTNDCKLTTPSAPLPFLNVNITEEPCSEFEYNKLVPDSRSELLNCTMEKFQKLSLDKSSKETYEIMLSLESEIDFSPGDSFSIVPQNYEIEIDLFLLLLNKQKEASHKCSFMVNQNTKKKNSRVPVHLNQGISLRNLVKYCLDIRTVPKKPFVRVLADYTHDPGEKRKLMELASRESSAYVSEIRESGVGLLDLLLIFKSCRPSLSVVLEHIPKLTPRSYSITTSPLFSKTSIGFAFNVIDIKINKFIVYNRQGISTGWLKQMCQVNLNRNITDQMNNLKLNSPNIKIFLRSNKSFRVPAYLSIPIIMVGPGTGVAPFMGFLMHKMLQAKLENCSTSKSLLFFGCRNEDNYIYKKDMTKYLKEGILTDLHMCFSRQKTGESSDKYVQDLIRGNKSKLAELICSQEAVVYVCGDIRNMTNDVRAAFVDIICDHLSLSESDGSKFVSQLQLDKRYIQDVWA